MIVAAGPLILIMTSPPYAGFITALGSAVQPLIHAPQAVETAGVGGIGVVDDTVFDDERAHPGAITRVSSAVGSRCRGKRGDELLAFGQLLRCCVLGRGDSGFESVIIFDAAAERLLAMMSSIAQTIKPATSTRRDQASANRSIPSGA